MARAVLPCALLFFVLLSACTAARPSYSLHLSTRRLLHAGHSHETADEDAADATNYLSSLQTEGVTPTERIDQIVSVDPTVGLNEDAVNSLMSSIQGYDCN